MDRSGRYSTQVIVTDTITRQTVYDTTMGGTNYPWEVGSLLRNAGTALQNETWSMQSFPSEQSAEVRYDEARADLLTASPELDPSLRVMSQEEMEAAAAGFLDPTNIDVVPIQTIDEVNARGDEALPLDDLLDAYVESTITDEERADGGRGDPS